LTLLILNFRPKLTYLTLFDKNYDFDISKILPNRKNLSLK
jgi:hypothetical protein